MAFAAYQTTFALFWMFCALVVMIRATRQASRQQWLGGAALLGVVMLKLMLVDSAGGGARAPSRLLAWRSWSDCGLFLAATA
ncbi:MAG: DUF2339 domain-containing protein [Enterobacter hormaechei]